MVELVLWVSVSVSWFCGVKVPHLLASAGSRAFDGLSGTNRKDTGRKFFFFFLLEEKIIIGKLDTVCKRELT